jgi:hypothetical protein
MPITQQIQQKRRRKKKGEQSADRMITLALKVVCLTIVALTTSVVLSMDLGEPYSMKETSIFTNVYFQAGATAAVSYVTTNNVISAALVTILWISMKFWLHDSSGEFKNIRDTSPTNYPLTPYIIVVSLCLAAALLTILSVPPPPPLVQFVSFIFSRAKPAPDADK